MIFCFSEKVSHPFVNSFETKFNWKTNIRDPERPQIQGVEGRSHMCMIT